MPHRVPPKGLYGNNIAQIVPYLFVFIGQPSRSVSQPADMSLRTVMAAWICPE